MIQPEIEARPGRLCVGVCVHIYIYIYIYIYMYKHTVEAIS